MTFSKATSRRGRLWPTLMMAVLTGSLSGGQVLFQNEAPQTGTTDKSLGRGSAWIDLDGDGLLDLVNANAQSPMSWFRQKPDHTFEDATALWSVPQDNLEHWVPVVADLDNDGDADVYIASGGRSSTHANQLLRNDIDPLTHLGSLTDVTASAGDAGFAGTSHGASALDYDRDGSVDLFVSGASGYGCTLLRNGGGLVFSDVSSAAGIDTPGNHRGCSAGDIDNDGWPDVGVAGFETPNRLFHNQADGTFLDVASSAGVENPSDHSFGMVFEDFDNDGWQDLFVPTLNANAPLGAPTRIYLNQGDLTYALTADLGSHKSMGHNAGDLDADGFPDVFVGTGNPVGAALDRLFRVTSSAPGQILVQDVSVAWGIQAMGPTRCHGLALGDYDQDGDVDVYANNGGAKFPTDEDGFLWRSGGNANAWVGLDLVGVRSNRSAIDARAVATTASGRRVHLLRSAGKGFGNSDAPTLHFGLGQESAAVRIDVQWPSGITQVLLSPGSGQRHELVETGLSLAQGSVPVGGTAVVEACGRAGFSSELLVSRQIGLDLPLPDLGGTLELVPPFFPIATLPLDGQGLGDLPVPVPSNPALGGQSLFFQAWTHGFGTLTDSTLTNFVELKIV